MLLVYGALVMGGIETFFVRLMKSRNKKGLVTKIILTQPADASHPELLREAKKYGEVFFIRELFSLPAPVLNIIPKAFYPSLPANKQLIGEIFNNVTQVHVSDAFSGIVAYSLQSKFEKKIPITVGFYHSKEFLWGARRDLPFFEKVNREFVFNCLPPRNLILFNESFVSLYERNGRDISEANCFPIGVVEKTPSLSTDYARELTNNIITVVSVGRLVDFKKYNHWMIKLVSEMKDVDIELQYHIYGDGPLEQSLRNFAIQLGVEEQVHFHGVLNYADFDITVAEFDVFVGSGTAIVQASAAGVPSIVGIENVAEPLSYGFFADIPGFSYNEDGLYEKVSVAALLKQYLRMPADDKLLLKKRHIEKAQTFSMSNCAENFELVGKNAEKLNSLDIPIFRYCASLLVNVVLAKLLKAHPLKFKYVD